MDKFNGQNKWTKRVSHCPSVFVHLRPKNGPSLSIPKRWTFMDLNGQIQWTKQMDKACFPLSICLCPSTSKKWSIIVHSQAVDVHGLEWTNSMDKTNGQSVFPTVHLSLSIYVQKMVHHCPFP